MKLEFFQKLAKNGKVTDIPTYMKLEYFQNLAKNGKVGDLSTLTHELRWIKSPAELKLMKESASIACQVLIGLCYI